jgi:hypothetical protein
MITPHKLTGIVKSLPPGKNYTIIKNVRGWHTLPEDLRAEIKRLQGMALISIFQPRSKDSDRSGVFDIVLQRLRGHADGI